MLDISCGTPHKKANSFSCYVIVAKIVARVIYDSDGMGIVGAV